MDEKTPIVKGETNDGSNPVFYGDGQAPSQRRNVVVCAIAVSLSVLVSLSLCIYRGVVKKVSHIAFLYFMFAATLIGIAAAHFIMVFFIKSGAISGGKFWFTYVSALLLVIQTILIDIVIFEK